MIIVYLAHREDRFVKHVFVVDPSFREKFVLDDVIQQRCPQVSHLPPVEWGG